MKHHVVAVRDSAVQAFQRPFIVPHRQVAVRSFVDEVNRADSEMNRHPGDYELHCLAMYDEVKGTFENLAAPELLVRAADVVKEKA